MDKKQAEAIANELWEASNHAINGYLYSDNVIHAKVEKMMDVWMLKRIIIQKHNQHFYFLVNGNDPFVLVVF